MTFYAANVRKTFETIEYFKNFCVFGLVQCNFLVYFCIQYYNL